MFTCNSVDGTAGGVFTGALASSMASAGSVGTTWLGDSAIAEALGHTGAKQQQYLLMGKQAAGVAE